MEGRSILMQWVLGSLCLMAPRPVPAPHTCCWGVIAQSWGNREQFRPEKPRSEMPEPRLTMACSTSLPPGWGWSPAVSWTLLCPSLLPSPRGPGLRGLCLSPPPTAALPAVPCPASPEAASSQAALSPSMPLAHSAGPSTSFSPSEQTHPAAMASPFQHLPSALTRCRQSAAAPGGTPGAPFWVLLLTEGRGSEGGWGGQRGAQVSTPVRSLLDLP